MQWSCLAHVILCCCFCAKGICFQRNQYCYFSCNVGPLYISFVYFCRLCDHFFAWQIWCSDSTDAFRMAVSHFQFTILIYVNCWYMLNRKATCNGVTKILTAFPCVRPLSPRIVFVHVTGLCEVFSIRTWFVQCYLFTVMLLPCRNDQ